MIREIRTTFLWCYRNDRKKFAETLGAFAITIAGCLLIGFIISLLSMGAQ